jgi:hypothetical protein
MKKAKRPLSASLNDTNWGTFFSCQGDEDYVILKGSPERKVFQPKLLKSISFLKVLRRIMKTSLLKKQTWKR